MSECRILFYFIYVITHCYAIVTMCFVSLYEMFIFNFTLLACLQWGNSFIICLVRLNEFCLFSSICFHVRGNTYNLLYWVLCKALGLVGRIIVTSSCITEQFKDTQQEKNEVKACWWKKKLLCKHGTQLSF